MLALRAAASKLGSERLAGCDLYVTLEPCAMCAGAISLARIRRLYYGAADAKSGGVDHGARVFSHATCHHAPEVYGGLSERQASALLKGFFANTGIFQFAESLGGTESLICHPATMTHRAMSQEDRDGAGVSDTLIRMSVGMEHKDDLLRALDTMFSNLQRAE